MMSVSSSIICYIYAVVSIFNVLKLLQRIVDENVWFYAIKSLYRVFQSFSLDENVTWYILSHRKCMLALFSYTGFCCCYERKIIMLRFIWEIFSSTMYQLFRKKYVLNSDSQYPIIYYIISVFHLFWNHKFIHICISLVWLSCESTLSNLFMHIWDFYTTNIT